MDTRKKNILDRGNSVCKGPEGEHGQCVWGTARSHCGWSNVGGVRRVESQGDHMGLPVNIRLELLYRVTRSPWRTEQRRIRSYL